MVAHLALAFFSLAHLDFTYDENDGDYWEDRFSDHGDFDDEHDFVDDHFDVFRGHDEDDDFDGDDLFGL